MRSNVIRCIFSWTPASDPFRVTRIRQGPGTHSRPAKHCLHQPVNQYRPSAAFELATVRTHQDAGAVHPQAAYCGNDNAPSSAAQCFTPHPDLLASCHSRKSCRPGVLQSMNRSDQAPVTSFTIVPDRTNDRAKPPSFHSLQITGAGMTSHTDIQIETRPSSSVTCVAGVGHGRVVSMSILPLAHIIGVYHPEPTRSHQRSRVAFCIV